MIARHAALVALACGCASPGPSAVVTLATDLPPCRLPTVRLRCAYEWDGVSPRDTASCEQVLYRGSSLAEVQLPASFGLRGDGSGRPLTLAIDDGAPSPILRRVARVTLPQDGDPARVTIVLRAACAEPGAATAERPCAPGSARCTLSQSCEQRAMTCGDEGACRAVELRADELAADPATVVEAPGLCDAGTPRG
ncbi:MAG: hypothetical protein Q8S73_12145 [Deltaproteobacteria bacterium]|nr:hypothetical protein [Myxococcales bacterium]MDP3214850.1 hypothetical protein [Deltaproteobacteria bacterium]